MNEVKITYLTELNPEQTDSAFYCWGTGFEALAKVQKGDRTFYVGSNGEMRIDLPNEGVVRYTSDLLEAGIDTDAKLSELLESHDWINNNWFEIYEEGADGEWWEVSDTLEEGIEAARHALDTELTNVSRV
jgi:hypothetical protein